MISHKDTLIQMEEVCDICAYYIGMLIFQSHPPIM